MSIQAVAWALDQKLPATVKLVLVAVCNHADHTDGYCWLKTQTIADEASCVERSVYRFIGALVRNGYIRKQKRRGDDGRQRANDYWVMFGREDAEWDWKAAGPDHASDACPDEPDDTISCEPDDLESPGEIVENSTGQSVEKPSESVGPGDIGVSHKSLAEPSKTNPKESLRPDSSAPPRAYRPPPQAPPQPMGVLVEQGARVFARSGTPAKEAWNAYKSKTTGVHWNLETTAIIDGKAYTGWWFPSLFPPSEPASNADPPKSVLMSEQDEKDFAEIG